MRIYLIGLPGSGKSTVGRQLAQVVGYTFIDLDDIIVARTGKSIPEIFSQSGEDNFRKLEAELLRELSKQDSFIMATGGGTPCFHQGIDFMNEQGKTVYLQTDPAEIASRLQINETHNRPLLKSSSAEETQQRLVDLLHARRVYYEQAHYCINQENNAPEAIMALLGLRPVKA